MTGIEVKVHNTSGLINQSQYDANKQNIYKKIEDVDKKYIT